MINQYEVAYNIIIQVKKEVINQYQGILIKIKYLMKKRKINY